MRSLMRGRLFGNFMSGIGARVINVVATFVATPVLLLSLGDAGYGFIVLLLGILGFGGLLDLGLTQSLVKALAQQSQPQKQSVYATAAWVYAGLAVLGAVLLFVGQNVLLMHVVNMPTEHGANMPIAFAFLALALALKMLSALWGAVLNAEELMHEANVAQTLANLLRLALCAGLAIVGWPLHWVVAAFPLSIFLGIVVQWLYLKRLVWWRAWHWQSSQRQHLRTLFRSASGIFFAQTSGELALHADKFIVSAALGVAALSPYNLAYLIVARVSDIGSLVAAVCFPRLVSMMAAQQWQQFWRFYWRAMAVTLLLGLLLVGAIAILGLWFLQLWVGAEQAYKTWPLLKPFLLGTFLGLPSWLNGNVLIALEKSMWVAFSVASGAMLSVLLCMHWVSVHGLLGAAWAWAFGYVWIAVVQACLLVWFFCCKNF